MATQKNILSTFLPFINKTASILYRNGGKFNKKSSFLQVPCPCLCKIIFFNFHQHDKKIVWPEDNFELVCIDIS